MALLVVSFVTLAGDIRAQNLSRLCNDDDGSSLASCLGIGKTIQDLVPNKAPV